MAKLSNRLTSALAPLGVVALVAGCGGGSMVAGGNGSTTFVPPGQTTAQTSKATLTLYVPARKGSANARSPRYVSPGTSKVTVAVAQAGAPSPWPNPTSTSVPTPGPSPQTGTPTPIPVTMSVDAPVGNAQFAVNTYDASGHLLSGVTSTPVPISSNAASNTITLTLNAAAECMQIDSQKSTMSGAESVAFYPFVHQTAAQTLSFVVTPCDIDGYPIPAGQKLANYLGFSNVNPKPALSGAREPRGQRQKQNAPVVTYSPSTITVGGPTTVTITEPVGAGSDVQYLEPSDSNSQYATISTTPIFYVMAGNTGSNNVSVFSASASNYGMLVGTVPTIGVPNAMVGGGPQSGCTSPGQAVTGNDAGGSFTVLTIPSPSASNPTPLPSPATVSGFVPPSAAPPVMMLDSSCTAYAGLSDGYLATLTQLATFTHMAYGPFSDPSDGSPAGSRGNAPISALGFLGGLGYVGLGPSSGGYMNSMVTTANLSLYPGFSAPGSLKAGTVDAIAPFDASHVAIAYHEAGGSGYLHFALYDGTSTTQDSNSNSAWTVTSMSTDAAGNVWAVASGQTSLIQYTPGTTPGAQKQTTQYLSATGNTMPSAVAVAPNGQIYVADSGANSIFVYNYNYSVVGGFGSTGVTLTTGTAPKSLVILP